MQNHQNPEPKAPQLLNPLPKVSSFDPSLPNLQHPESKTPQFFNPLPEVSSFDPSLQNHRNPESKTLQIFNPLSKVSSFEPPLQNIQHPESKSSQFFNPLPIVPSFEPPLQNHQNPESKSPQILNPLPKFPSFDSTLQNLQHPESKTSQFFNLLPKVPSFATITAASVFLFLGFCQNGFINKPTTTTLSSIVSIQTLDEKTNLEEILGTKSDTVQTVLHLKLKEKIPIVHSFKKIKTDDDEAWQVLKDQVSSCSAELELVKVGFEEILEKDPWCNKAYHDRVLEYLEVVDECKSLLKGIKVAMDRCEREDRDVRYHLRFFNKLIARIRVLEGDMVGALKHFQELEQEE